MVELDIGEFLSGDHRFECGGGTGKALHPEGFQAVHSI